MEGRPSGPHLTETNPKDDHANAFYGECVDNCCPCNTAVPCAQGVWALLARYRNQAPVPP